MVRRGPYQRTGTKSGISRTSRSSAVPEDGMTFVIRMRDAMAPATAGRGTGVGREAADK